MEALLSDDANKAAAPLLDAAEFGYQTAFQEKLLAVQEDVTLMEFTGSGLVRTGGVAVSMPVGEAGRYRVSSRSVRSRIAWQAVAKGRVLIADRAIIFDGDEMHERVTWGKVSERNTPFNKWSFETWFRGHYRAAGIEKSAHGIRKLSATLAAEGAASSKQSMAQYG